MHPKKNCFNCPVVQVLQNTIDDLAKSNEILQRRAAGKPEREPVLTTAISEPEQPFCLRKFYLN